MTSWSALGALDFRRAIARDLAYERLAIVLSANASAGGPVERWVRPDSTVP